MSVAAAISGVLAVEFADLVTVVAVLLVAAIVLLVLLAVYESVVRRLSGRLAQPEADESREPASAASPPVPPARPAPPPQPAPAPAPALPVAAPPPRPPLQAPSPAGSVGGWGAPEGSVAAAREPYTPGGHDPKDREGPKHLW